jgi:hypothetical protein
MKFTLPALVVLSHFSFQALANAGFASSCNSYGVYTNPKPWDLIGSCRKISGIYELDVVLHLNSCIVNSYGTMVYQQKYDIPLHSRLKT